MEINHAQSADVICNACNGSGEGLYEGTTCRSCRGAGTTASDSGDTDPGDTVDVMQWRRDMTAWAERWRLASHWFPWTLERRGQRR